MVREVESEVRGRSGPSPWGPPAHLALAGTPENRLKSVSCMAPEPSPRAPTSLWGKQWTSPLSLCLWPHSSGRLPGLLSVGPGLSPLGSPEEPEGHVGWAPGSFSDDGWGGSWDLVLRELPAELCLLLARPRTLEGESCSLGHCPFLSGQRITFVW